MSTTFNPQAKEAELRSAAGQTAFLTNLRGVPLAAFSGIGNPAGFEQMLRQACGYAVTTHRTFPDHHDYSAEEVEGGAVRRRKVAKKPAAKKPVARKPAAKKPAARKPAARKPAAKKSAARK